MPTYLKFAVSFCAEVFFIILGGVAGAWLAVRDIPAGEDGGPGGGIGVFIFGMIGMMVAGMVGIVGLVIFWSVLAMRQEATAQEATAQEATAQEAGRAKSSAPKAEGLWPPAPRKSGGEREA